MDHILLFISLSLERRLSAIFVAVLTGVRFRVILHAVFVPLLVL